MRRQLTVSLIATVKNERDSLREWLTAIERQTRLPDEVVVIDGGSTDGTWELLASWEAPCKLMLYSLPGASISAGRNLAMHRASGDVFAITDAGTIAAPDWLERLLVPFGTDTVDVAAGFFKPVLRTRWQRSLAATTLPDIDEIDGDAFLPSSRSVALRAAWVRGGFEYPEWLDYCEDLVWDVQLKRGGARFEFAPGAYVQFFVRSGWRSFARQYFRYARGDGKAGLFPRRHLIRYATYLAAGIVLSRRRRSDLAVTSILGGVYVYRPVRRLMLRDRENSVSAAQTMTALPLIPFQRLIGDVAKMIGYPLGLWWRLRRYGRVGHRTAWPRIKTDGSLWHPESTVSETQQPADPTGAAPRQARPQTTARHE